MIALLVLHGFELFAIGIIGEYVWRALDQVRPQSHLSDRLLQAPMSRSDES